MLSSARKVSIAFGLKNTRTGEYSSHGVRTYEEAPGWRITVSFPDDGDYELELLARLEGEKDHVSVAKARFRAKLDGGASGLLARAATQQDLARMQKALKSGANPDAAIKGFRTYTRDDQTVVVDATPVFAVLGWYNALEDQLAALRLLKSSGADFKALSSEGSTVLSEFFDSSWAGNTQERMKLFRLLLELGADPAQETDYVYILNGNLLHSKVSILLHMERSGYRNAADLAPYVPLLVRAGAARNPRWPSGESALENHFRRLDEGSAPLIRAHLEAGTDPDPMALRGMAFAVSSSKFGGDYELISRVLSATSHLNDGDRWGSTVLHTIMEIEKMPAPARAKLFDLLVARGADFYRSDRYGRTPLMVAVEKGNLAAVDELLARGVDPRRTGSRGQNVYHCLPPGQTELSAKLIDRFSPLGVDINAKDEGGATPLRSVVSKGDYPEMLKLLVSRGADPALPDIDGLTAIGYARNKAYKGTIAYLGSLKVPDTVGGWPVGNGAVACKAVLAADLETIASLPINVLQEMTARTADGVPATPLHLAVERGNLAVIAALSARKVDWNVGDRYGRPPLEIAVLAGARDVAAALLKAAADPNRLSSSGESPYSRSIAAGSPVSETLFASEIAPEWNTVGIAAAVSSPLDQVLKLAPPTAWSAGFLDTFALLGRLDVLRALGDSVRNELLEKAKTAADAFAAYEAAREPKEGRRVAEAEKNRKGSYTLTLVDFSPWMEPDPALDLKKYPVAVYVPKGYDGTQPYGLMISMMNAQGSSQQPRPEYLATLDARHLLHVGFDPYNGVFDGGSEELMFTNHERLALAAVYHMFGAYNVDRGRVYLTGFSWGGRITGEVVPRQPRIFTGGIAVGGCFTSDERVIPSYPFARRNTAMVLVTGDWDYNRQETWGGYNTFLQLGYKAWFFQEPRRGHRPVTGEVFEKAVGLLDAAALARK